MTEQEKYGMDQLLKYLEMQINLKSDRIRMYKKQMDSNYLYYFAWAGKDLFKAYYMIEKYKELRQVLKKAKRPEEVHEYLQTERGKCVRELVNGPIYIHYSDEIFNLAHSYRTECTQQLIQDYNGFGQLLSKKKKKKKKPPRQKVKTETEPETMKKKSNGLKM